MGNDQDPARACYGPKHVEVAHERMAVQTLLITDDLFRLEVIEIVLNLDIVILNLVIAY